MMTESIDQRRFDVAVVGAGLVGLTAALAFADAGLRVAIVGDRPAKAALSEGYDVRIYAIAPSAQAFLQRLRVWAALPQQRLTRVESMRVWGDATGNGQLDLSAYAAALPELCWIAEHGALQNALVDALSFQRDVNWIGGRFVALQSPAADGIREILLDDSTSLRASLIAACDGGDSPVRAAAGIASMVKPYQQQGVVANFTCELPHMGTAHQWFRNDGILALLPLPENRVSMVWSATEVLASELMGAEPAALCDTVCSASGNRLGALQLIGKRAAFPLRLVVADRLAAQGVALLGDAAHVVHPLAGHGLNLGLGDVDALLAAVNGRAAFHAPGDRHVLRAFERQRAEPVAAMRAVTDGLQRLFGSADPGLTLVRNAGMNLVDRLGVIKKQLIVRAVGRA